MDQPETRYARTIDGLSVAYQVVGRGPYDLVCTQGWTSNVDAMWQEVPQLAAFCRQLGARARLIMFDRRGSGQSDRPSSVESLSLEVGMDDIRAVMDAAGSSRAVLFGFEDGGMLAALFAASFPERTSALVLFGSWAKATASPDYPWGWADERYDEWLEQLEKGWGGVEFARRDLALTAPALVNDEAFLESWARYLRLCASPGAIMAIERMHRETDVRHALSAIRVPTLVMHRIDDPTEDVAQARYIAERIPGAKLALLPGDAHAPWAGDVAAVLDELQRFLAGVHDEEAELDRVLATVLFTDIVGSTDKLADLGDRGWKDVLDRHHAVVRGLLARYRGQEVDTAGDGFFATFDGPARAIRSALAISEAVKPIGIQVRAGLHTGEVAKVDSKVGGIAVNIGARICSLAGDSEVLVSQTVKDLVAGSGLRFEDQGTKALKGIPDEWRLYAVIAGEAS